MRCSFGGGRSRKTVVKSHVNWYDYGARFYDPQIARWHVKDPLCEYQFNMTPYNYVRNNPMLYIDPFGLKDTTFKAPPLEEVKVYPKTLSVSLGVGSRKESWFDAFIKFLDKMKHWQPGGLEMTIRGGSGSPGVRADHSEYIGDIEGLIYLVGYAGGMGPFAVPTLPLAELTVRLNTIADEVNNLPDKEIIKKSTGENTTPTDANGGTENVKEYGEGRYRTWEKTKSLIGQRFEATTGDSVLTISSRGDSTLWVDSQSAKGNGRDWRMKIPLKNKK